ncbi:NADH kinase pos5 [Apophysomyces sp. BC1034]|nr:NADH kinase pos5 [Apophysomyces sp. BC1021]KAG0194471.1 NADH kinase pos5 [Apophysomyces sp. BC1034]
MLRKTNTLPDKVDLNLTREEWRLDSEPGREVESMVDRIKTRKTSNIRQVPGSTYGGQFTLDWTERPRTVLIVKKPNDVKTENALIQMATWLHEHQPNLNIVVEPEVAEQFHEKLPFVHVIDRNQKQEYTRTVDFAITLGGDGTILHLSSLFPKSAPPVLCFSMGTLGFLMSFHYSNFQRVLKDVIDGKVSLMLRMRLFCSLHQSDGKRISVDGKEIGMVYFGLRWVSGSKTPVKGDWQAMNEVSLHRGRYSHLTYIDCYVDDQYLTECVIGEASRSQIEVSVDGQEIFMLNKGDYLKVRMSKYPIPCVARINADNDWATDINELLKWNQNFGRNLA